MLYFVRVDMVLQVDVLIKVLTSESAKTPEVFICGGAELGEI